MNKNKIIGITCDYDSGGSRDSILTGRGCYYLAESYALKVREQGAIPLIITPTSSKRQNLKLLSLVDGLILTGGRSIDPDLYGAEPDKDVGSLSIERYRKEMPFIKLAIKKRKAILGICAGHQAINVACGGTLIQNVNSVKETTIAHMQQAPRKEPTHHININVGSILHKIVGKSKIRVNSFHQQSINKLGKNLIVTAKSPDGIVEAIEMKGRKNIIGVQYHPESLEDNYSSMLFKYFIKLCK